MRKNWLSDLLVNVICPLGAGAGVYYVPTGPTIPAGIRNYLPDAMWAYSFMSAILILWGRTIHPLWVMVVFVFGALYEAGQYLHVIDGTGDVLDVLVYYLSFLSALLINSLYTSRKTIPQPI